MVEVTYHCPYCGALTSLERDAYLADRCVTPEPLEGWEYAPTTGDYERADGVEFVCLGDASPADDDLIPDPDAADYGGIDDDRVAAEDTDPGEVTDDDVGDGCGRTFYLSFVRYEDGEEVDPHVAFADGEGPRFDFLR